MRSAPGPPRLAARCRAVAWVTGAALLALLFVQPLHAASARWRGGATVAAVQLEAPGHAGTPKGHDGDHCLFCQGAAAARVGLAPQEPCFALAANGPALSLLPPTASPAISARAPHSASPRAPPVPFVPSV